MQSKQQNPCAPVERVANGGGNVAPTTQQAAAEIDERFNNVFASLNPLTIPTAATDGDDLQLDTYDPNDPAGVTDTEISTFDLSLFPPRLADYIKNVADNNAASHSAAAIACISAISAAVSLHYRAEIPAINSKWEDREKSQHWHVKTAGIFGLIVARSGKGKSELLNEFKRPLVRHDRFLLQQFRQDKKQYEQHSNKKDAASVKMAEPRRRKICLDKATEAGILTQCVNNSDPDTETMQTPVFVSKGETYGYFLQMATDRTGDKSDFFCKMFDGGDLQNMTQTNGITNVESAKCAFCGGIQTEILKQIDAYNVMYNQGVFSRLFIVYDEERKRPKYDNATDAAGVMYYDNMITAALNAINTTLYFDEEATALFYKWHDNLLTWAEKQNNDFYDSVSSKATFVCERLALCSAAMRGTARAAVTADDVRPAIRCANFMLYGLRTYNQTRQNATAEPVKMDVPTAFNMLYSKFSDEWKKDHSLTDISRYFGMGDEWAKTLIKRAKKTGTKGKL